MALVEGHKASWDNHSSCFSCSHWSFESQASFDVDFGYLNFGGKQKHTYGSQGQVHRWEEEGGQRSRDPRCSQFILGVMSALGLPETSEASSGKSKLKTLSPNAKSTVPHFKAVTCDEAIIDNDRKTFKVTKLLKGEIHAFCKCYSLISWYRAKLQFISFQTY